MRFAALLCGLAAGLLLLAMPRQAGIDLMPEYLKLWSDTENQQLVAQLVWYAIPAASLLGALLVWLVPGVAAVLLLASGLGWAGIEILLPDQVQLLTTAPAVASVLGSVFAYIAGEIASQRRRERRLRERDEQSPVRAALRDPDIVAREAALRMDPLTMERRSPAQVAPANSTRPRYDIPLTLEDPAVSQRRDARSAPLGPPEPVIGAPSGPVVSTAGGADRPYVHSAVQSSRSEARLDEFRAPSPAPARSGLVGWFAAVNVVVLALIGLGVGYLFLERGVDPGARAVATGTTLGAPAASGTATPPAAAATPANLAAAERYTEPFTYCAAVGTIDRVDQRYFGPYLIPEMAAALRVPANTSPDRVRWRCANGLVLACTSFGWPICDKTPDTAEMLAFCQRNNDVARLLAPSGTWSCKAGKPEIPANASWPIDDRGFLPNAWQPILKADPSPTGG